MKTKTKTSEIKLTKRVQEAVLTKSGLVHKNYYYALVNSRIIGNRIYPKQWGSKGRSLRDYSHYITSILKACNYKIKKDNTAPRGGVEGDCFVLSKQALQVIEDIKNYNLQF